MVLNYINSQAFVSKLFRDLKLTDSDFIPDVYEWIMEALQEMGAKSFFKEVEKDLLVRNYRVELPKDLYRLIDVAKDDVNVPYSKKPITNDTEDLTYTAAKIGTPIATLSNEPDVDSEGNPINVVNYITPSILVTTDYLTPNYYFVNGNYIITSFTDETITIRYHAAITEKGIPVIPDDATVKNALMYYVLSRLVLGGFKHPDPQLTFINLQTLWEKYKNRASIKVMFPTQDQAKTFARNWATLIPQNNFL